MLEFIAFSAPALVFLLVRHPRVEARGVIGLRSARAADYAWALGAAGVLAVLAWVVMWGVPDALVHGSGTAGRITSLLAALSVVFRSVGEEVFFRGFVQGLLRRRLAAWPANLIQGTLFVLMHLPLLLVDLRFWPILPVQFVAGLVMGWLRERTGSVGPPALTHAVINVVAGLI